MYDSYLLSVTRGCRYFFIVVHCMHSNSRPLILYCPGCDVILTAVDSTKKWCVRLHVYVRALWNQRELVFISPTSQSQP